MNAPPPSSMNSSPTNDCPFPHHTHERVKNATPSTPESPDASSVGGAAPHRNRFELGLPRRTRAPEGSSR